MSASKQLSSEELKYIDAFCKKKDIAYIDLRIELVDHLAELVLTRQANHPQENFKAAFYAVYKSYGIFGFLDVAQEHQNQMQKRYWREIWQYFKTWITPPKVLATGSVFGLIYLIGDTFPAANSIIIACTGIVFFTSIILTIWQYQYNKKILNGEQNMLMGGGRQGIVIFGYVLWIIVFNSGPQARAYLIDQPWFVAFFFVLVCLFLGANYGLLNKAKTQLLELKAQMS